MINKVEWSLKMETEQEARRAIHDSAKAFYVLAAIEAVLAFVVGLWALGDAGIFALLGFWLQRRESKVAAVLLLLVSAYGIYSTAVNRFGGGQGGQNIVLSVITCWVALRATVACFKLPALAGKEQPAPETTKIG
jgi:hypothetical protein